MPIRASIKRLLMPIDDSLRQSDFRPAHNARMLKMQRGNDRRIPLEQQIHRLVIHERAMLDRVITGSQRIDDARRRTAMPSNLHRMIVSRLDNRVHLLECHAERVVIVGIRRRCVASRIRLHPLHAIFHEFADSRASVVCAIDEQDETLHADFAIVRIPVHQSADAARFSRPLEASAGRE